MTTFNSLQLPEPLAQAVTDQGYVTPTPIQARGIPLVREGRDVLGKSRTGTGKTACFALPLLERLLPESRSQYRALILAPTRELAAQVHSDLEAFARHTKLHGVLVTGGVDLHSQEHRVRLGGDWIVSTPGRLGDLLRARIVEFAALEMLVLDEADRLLELGFIDEVRHIVSFLPVRRQTLFFSATLPPETQELAKTLLISPARLDIDATDSAAGLAEEHWPVSARQKYDLLNELIDRGDVAGRVLVFVRTRIKTEKVAARLAKSGRASVGLHGEMSMPERSAALESFRSGETAFLVSTDLAARGIDVHDVDIVLNYDVPSAPEDYIHRVGRTARAGKGGRAMTFQSREELALLAQIERMLARRLPERRLDGFDYEKEPEEGYAVRSQKRGPADFNKRTAEGGKKVSPFTKAGKARPAFDAAPSKPKKPKKIRNRRLPHQR